MTKPRLLGLVLFVAMLSLGSCEQTLRTGKVGNTRNAPSADGTCPTGLSVCGKGNFAQCLDLQTDREHCGTCDKACVAGIACAAGVCQQVACTGEVTVSTQPVAGLASAAEAPLYSGGILADINGDGRPDLVTWGFTPGSAQDAFFQVALGKAEGGLTAPSTYQTFMSAFRMVAADSNSDGFDDLYLYGGTLGPVCLELWLGHGDGSLTLSEDISTSDCMMPTALADLNGDGKLDIVTDGWNGPTVFLGDANGDFHTGTNYPFRRSATLVRDWNGDGFPDLLSANGTLVVSLNDGSGRFDGGENCGVATSYQEVVADFNRDGHLDLADGMGDSVGVLLGMGGCQFQTMTEYPLALVKQVVNGDVTGDGIEDLVARTSAGEIALLVGVGDGTFRTTQLSAGDGPSSGYYEYGSLLVGDVTGDGKADVVVIPGRLNGGPAALPPVSRVLENTCP